MLKIYGSMLCADCVACVEELTKANVPFEMCDFSDQLIYLKEFLKIRDGNPMFDEARNSGAIGIPCIVDDDGNATLDWALFLKG